MDEEGQLRQELVKLGDRRQKHIDLGKSLAPVRGDLYLLDMLAFVALDRSLALIRGFTMLVEDRNYIVAAPLVRLQLDNCLRFSASTHVDDINAFVLAVINGDRIDKLKSRTGKPLTDRYLADSLATLYPWVSSVYEGTSGFIHLSSKHVLNTITTQAESDQFEMRLTGGSENVPLSAYLEAVQGFTAITDLLLQQIIGSWAKVKTNHAKAAQAAGETHEET